MKNKELANGRVAMCAVLTFWLYEYGDKISPSAQLGEANWLAVAGSVMLLGFAWGNPKGWPAEYVPTLVATGGTLYPAEVETVNLSAKLPASLKESQKVQEAVAA